MSSLNATLFRATFLVIIFVSWAVFVQVFPYYIWTFLGWFDSSGMWLIALVVYLLTVLLAICPGHFHLSVYFLYVIYNSCFCLIHSILFRSLLVIPSMVCWLLKSFLLIFIFNTQSHSHRLERMRWFLRMLSFRWNGIVDLKWCYFF